MTDEAPETRSGPGSGELADPADQTQPVEGGRAEMADLPGADTAEDPAEEETDRAVD